MALDLRRALEGWLRPTLVVSGRAVSTFQICGLTGFALAVAIALLLSARLGLSAAIFAGLTAVSVGAFFGVALLGRAISGEERLVFYHHEAAILGVSTIVLALVNTPVLRYLDVVAVSLGLLLSVGRIGCLNVGCCHGRPHGLGLRYRAQHAEAGFPEVLVGVPLLPVQAVESLIVLALTAVSIARLASGAAPGVTLAGQFAFYALTRTGLEVARGDPGRPEWGGLSEAQWTSLVFALAVAGAERAGLLPRSCWHMAAAVGTAIAALVIVFVRRRPGSRHRLLAPAHVEEVARAIADDCPPVLSACPPVRVHTTSLGVRLSTSSLVEAGTRSYVYMLSGVDERAARALSVLIRRLRPHGGHGELTERRPGLFQLVVRATDLHEP